MCTTCKRCCRPFLIMFIIHLSSLYYKIHIHLHVYELMFTLFTVFDVTKCFWHDSCQKCQPSKTVYMLKCYQKRKKCSCINFCRFWCLNRQFTQLWQSDQELLYQWSVESVKTNACFDCLGWKCDKTDRIDSWSWPFSLSKLIFGIAVNAYREKKTWQKLLLYVKNLS